MPSISVPTALAIGAGVTAVGGIASGVVGAGAAKDAASLQAGAARNAATAQLAMFNTQSANLKPWLTGGQGGLNQLNALTGTGPGGNPLTAPLTSPFKPTMEQLASTPGYQFSLDQGLKATQNGFAAQGLGQSGAAAKGAAQFAEGLAGTTYQQQFSNDLAQKQQIYNMLGGISASGQNAGTMTANMGMAAQTQAGAFNTSAAAANAAGIVGGANAAIGGLGAVSGAAGNFATLAALRGMYG